MGQKGHLIFIKITRQLKKLKTIVKTIEKPTKSPQCCLGGILTTFKKQTNKSLHHLNFPNIKRWKHISKHYKIKIFLPKAAKAKKKTP